MRFINIRDEIVEAPGDSWPVGLPELPADVVMVVFPDDGDPWIEREPFGGREKSPEIVGMVRHLLIKPEEPADEQDGEEEPEEDLVDVVALLQQDLETIFAEHSTTSGAEVARDAVRATIPTLTDPDNYDVETAFRARLRRHLFINPTEEGPEEEPEEDRVDVTTFLQQRLDSVYADHADTPGAEAARDAVRDTIPTLTDPESYDVETAFRARLRRHS